MDLRTRDRARPHVLGISVDAFTMTQAVTRCTDAMDSGKYLSIGVVNAAKIVAMRQDLRLRQAVSECEMILADGQSVVWASRMLGVPLPERVTGIDLFQRLLAEAVRRGSRVYFLGARPDVLARMLDEVGRAFPGLPVAGARDGYFTPAQEREVAEEIRQSGADLLFVGMSSPKKELFLSRWGQATGASVVHGVGGSFDILAGVTQRAPLWYQKHGLEWLYRVRQEPLRLSRRYLTTNASFMVMVAREMITGRAARRTALPLTAPPGAPASTGQPPALGPSQMVAMTPGEGP